MSSSTLNNQSTILDRALTATGVPTAATAEYLLSIQLDPSDADRANKLAERAREGELTAAEQAEIDEYRRVGKVVEMLKLRARLALNKAG